MIVYIEDSIIENFLVTLLLLLSLNKIFRTQSNKCKLFFASLFAGIISTFYPLIHFNGAIEIIFKLCTGIVIVCIYCGKDGLFAKYVTFIFLTALYGGINILIYYFAYGTANVTDNFPTYVLIGLLFAIYYLFCSIMKLMQKNFVITNFVYNIKIINNNEEYFDVAFLDSGNTLIDKETNMPIFIINLKLFNKLYKNIKLEDILLKNYQNLRDVHYVKSGFASGSGKILVFSVDELEINSSNKKILINNAKLGLAYSNFNKNFNCNMLLNINIFATN